jgi:hypothetical protein
LVFEAGRQHEVRQLVDGMEVVIEEGAVPERVAGALRRLARDAGDLVGEAVVGDSAPQ